MSDCTEYCVDMKPVYVTDPVDLHAVAKFYEGAKEIFFDLEYSGFDVYTCVPWLLQIKRRDSKEVHVVDLQRANQSPTGKMVGNPDISPLKSVLEAATLVVAEGKGDLKYCRHMGIRPRRVWDVINTGRVLTAGKMMKNSLAMLSERCLGFPIDKAQRNVFIKHPREVSFMKAAPQWTPADIRYSAIDVYVLEDIMERQRLEATAEELLPTVVLENRLVAVIADMEYVGVYVDPEMWLHLTALAEAEMMKLRGKVCEMLARPGTQISMFEEITGSKYDINLESSKEVLACFKALGIDIENTEDDTLKKLRLPVADELRAYRGQQKQVSTYGRTWIAKQNPITGRIHTTFRQTGGSYEDKDDGKSGANSGRLSSQNPNTQNVPTPDEDAPGIDYRACFKAKPGYLYVGADYSQVEMRIIAEMAGDEAMKRIVRAGGDLHQRTASIMFNKPIEECGKGSKYRKYGKVLNFALVYGFGDQSLADTLGVPIKEGKRIKQQYFDAFPQVAAFIRLSGEDPFSKGFTKTLLGRKRWYNLPDAMKLPRREVDRQNSSIRNQGTNTPVQGCVIGTTRVFEESLGYVPIESLAGQSVSLWDGCQFARSSIAASGKKRLVKVELSGGHYIECSPDHRFLIRDCVGGEHWKSIDELLAHKTLANLRVVLTDEIPDWSCRIVVPKTDIYTNNNGVDRCISDMGDLEEMGEWLGRLASDGSLTINGAIIQLVAEHEDALVARLAEISGCLGNVVITQRMPEGNRKEILHKIRIHSRSICRQIREIGIKERVPEYAYTHPMLLSSYLRGVFDGDGTVSKDGAILVFGKGSKHLEWARQIQEGLLLLGVRSRVRSYESSRTVVQITKADMPKFCSRVGFMNPKKQKKAEAVKGDHKYLNPAYGKAQRIKNIEITDEYVEMYDVVDSETHRFMANGLVTHNSSADITKLAMVTVADAILAGGWGAEIVNSIHDELLIEVIAEQAEALKKIVEYEMVKAGEFFLSDVPVKVDTYISDHWVKD